MSRRHAARLPHPVRDRAVIIQEPPLPPLLVGIYRGDVLERVVEMADPRAKYCRAVDDQGADFGITARPIAAGEGVPHA